MGTFLHHDNDAFVVCVCMLNWCLLQLGCDVAWLWNSPLVMHDPLVLPYLQALLL